MADRPDDLIDDDEEVLDVLPGPEGAGPVAAEAAPPGPRVARRPRFGALVEGLGARASGTPRAPRPDKLLAQREHSAKAKQLLSGGVNAGEQKGYGATAGVVDPPPNPG